MKNLFIAGVLSVVMFGAVSAPAYAQMVVKSSTSTEPVLMGDLDVLRQQLITLLFELIDRLQAQIDAQEKADQTRETRISKIEREVESTRSAVPEIEAVIESDSIGEARALLGALTAAASVQEDDDVPVVELSITDYLDVDTVTVSANTDPRHTEESCDGGIAGSSYKSCAQYVRYALPTDSNLIISISVNDQEKKLIVTSDSRLERATWPRP